MVGTVVIKRVFNTNVAMVTSDDGSELIVIGRGLCFGRHAGDAIDEASVEKTYALQEGSSQDSRTIDRLAHLLESIPTVNLVISEDIVQMLRRELNVDINDKILIALADHISLALERERKGVSCENPLLLEIQQFYRKEYALAGRADERGGAGLHYLAYRQRHHAATLRSSDRFGPACSRRARDCFQALCYDPR